MVIPFDLAHLARGGLCCTVEPSASAPIFTYADEKGASQCVIERFSGKDAFSGAQKEQ